MIPKFICKQTGPCAVALGAFDGLHLGHRAVITRACGVLWDGVKPYLPSVVLSVTGVPKRDGCHLCGEGEREHLLRTLGVDEWIDLPFESVREMSPEAFVEEILHRRLDARVVCCGENYRFGKNAAGDAALLTALCGQYGIKAVVVPSVTKEGETVSSTAVREALETGDVERAAGLLGRAYTLCGKVTQGQHLGTDLGFPTANLPWEEGRFLPRRGVYASTALVDGVERFAVTNIGVHPTVGAAVTPVAETRIEGISGDLYGKDLTVRLITFLREERTFASTDALCRQMEEDFRQAHAYLSGEDNKRRAVLFDFDDTLHDRKIAFKEVARVLTKLHQPQLSEDEINERADRMLEANHGGYVVYDDYFTEIFRRWDWGDLSSPEDLYTEYRHLFPNYVQLFDDTAETLKVLHRRGYRIGLVTNGDVLTQERKLDIAGIRPYADTALIGKSEGVSKPDPEIFRRAAARLGVAPERCVFVGDHAKNDLEGSYRAGMKPVFLRCREQTAPPPASVPLLATVTRPSELLDIL